MERLYLLQRQLPLHPAAAARPNTSSSGSSIGRMIRGKPPCPGDVFVGQGLSAELPVVSVKLGGLALP